MSTWKTIFDELPLDGQEVWVRLISVYGELALATYDSFNQSFLLSTTNLTFPAYQVSRWKFYQSAPDADAVAFIDACQFEANSVMSARNKSAVFSLVSNLKGIGTLNGTNFWDIVDKDISYLLPYIPINNTTATVATFKINLFKPTNFKTFTAFVAGDFNVNGLTGGTAKFVNTGVAYSSFPQDNQCFAAFSRTSLTGARALFGAVSTVAPLGSVYLAPRTSSNTVAGSCATAVTSSFVNTNSVGFFAVNRRNSANFNIVRNAVINNFAVASVPCHNFNIYLHANNLNNTSVADVSAHQITTQIGLNVGLTNNQLLDLYECVVNYNTILNRNI